MSDRSQVSEEIGKRKAQLTVLISVTVKQLLFIRAVFGIVDGVKRHQSSSSPSSDLDFIFIASREIVHPHIWVVTLAACIGMLRWFSGRIWKCDRFRKCRSISIRILQSALDVLLCQPRVSR
jgi:hypothetical protein